MRAAGFDRPAESAQHRFIHRSLDEFTGLVSTSNARSPTSPSTHGVSRDSASPRTVYAPFRRTIVELARQHSAMPFHIHVAEQTAEADE